MIQLRTFGLVDIRASDGSEFPEVLAQPKRLALLVYLAVALPHGVHRRDRLLALFWPEAEDARARDALNQSLRFLRKALVPRALVRRSTEDVGIDPTVLWSDVRAFRAAAEAERWGDALDLYRADFLQGFFVEGASGFEHWMEEERTALRRLAARGARELARRNEADGALTMAIAWGRRALTLTPDDERALRELLALHVRAGDHAGALQLYDDFVRRLEREWDSAPAPETRRLVEDLRGGILAEVVDVAGSASAVDRDGNGGGTPNQEDDLHSLAARYRIEHRLGAGGTATVYLARDTKHDRDVAVKVLVPEITEGLARDRFIREIRIAGRLQHPGIVPLFDSGEADGRLYYVMPVVRGETLRHRLRRGPMTLPEVLTIMREVADSLGYAHDHGVVHRDIKPENVLLVGTRAVVTDFGIARAAEVARTPTGGDAMRLTQPGTSLGTPAYMSPEQAAGDPQVSHLADLYSLGVLGYEMLAGRPPFVGSTPQEILAAKLTQRPPSVLKFRPEAPRWLADLLMRCLERNPTERPQSARTIAQLVADPAGPNGSQSLIRRVLARFRPIRPRSGRTSVIRRVTTAITAIALLAAGVWRISSAGAGAGDPTLVAVLPFRVAGNGSDALEELREGVVDLMAIYLTGEEGGLHTVEPTTLFRAWRERTGDRSDGGDLADRDGIALARSLGAGWMLRGSLIGTGGDVLLRASLTPVGRGREVHASVAGKSDSLLAYVPRLLGRILAQLDGVPPDQSRSLTTTALSAVRAYLIGQDHYRHGEYALAVDRFTEALAIDSSFALAGLGLLMAQEWAGTLSEAATGTVTAATWRNRDQLRAKDRALVEAVVGPNGTNPSALADVQSIRERATIVAPDRFESWYLLGDHLFHIGALLGIDQQFARAEQAFRQALALDPGQAGVLQHLLLLAALRHDTAEVRARWTDYRASVHDPAVQFKDLWLVGQFLNDSTLTADALARMDASLESQPGLDQLVFSVSLFPQLLPQLQSLLQRAESTAQGRERRAQLAHLRWWLTLDAGRPEEAGRILTQMGGVRPDDVMLAELFWDAVPSGGPRAAARLSGKLGACVLGVAHASEGLWDEVAEAIAGLEGPTDISERSPPLDLDQVCAAILEAAHAQGTGRPDAHRLIFALDTLLMTAPHLSLTWENLMVARLLEGEGEYRHAAAAATRYRYALGYPSYFSTYLREAGRLATLAGDRELAAQNLRRYLALRRHPERGREQEVAEVRRTLAQLANHQE